MSKPSVHSQFHINPHRENRYEEVIRHEKTDNSQSNARRKIEDIKFRQQMQQLESETLLNSYEY